MALEISRVNSIKFRGFEKKIGIRVSQHFRFNALKLVELRDYFVLGFFLVLSI